MVPRVKSKQYEDFQLRWCNLNINNNGIRGDFFSVLASVFLVLS